MLLPGPGEVRFSEDEGPVQAMQISKLQIDGQIFFLAPEQDVPELKKQIVSAARGGAGFVDFEAVGHGRVSVLITPTESARFEIIQRSDEEGAGWQSDPPSFDIENYVD